MWLQAPYGEPFFKQFQPTSKYAQPCSAHMRAQAGPVAPLTGPAAVAFLLQPTFLTVQSQGHMFRHRCLRCALRQFQHVPVAALAISETLAFLVQTCRSSLRTTMPHGTLGLPCRHFRTCFFQDLPQATGRKRVDRGNGGR